MKFNIFKTKNFRYFIPFISVIIALLIGFIIIVLTKDIQTAFNAYKGLWDGSFGRYKSLMNTLVTSTPYILAGLAVAIGFQGGLFNIGAEGQIYIGALISAIVGFKINFLPFPFHTILALVCGFIGGFIWGYIPGYLKARTGAHEVINTIMMNYIAISLVDYLVKNVFNDKTSTIPRTPFIQDSAKVPLLVPHTRLHFGFIIALFLVFSFYLILRYTIWGFQLKTVGLNPRSAFVNGIKIKKTLILTLAISGGIAGIAGSIEVLGLNYSLPAAFVTGYGYDSIAVALLAGNNPLAIVPAGILWGALKNGASLMQLRSGISIDLINIIQALVITFIVADKIIYWLFKLKPEKKPVVMVFTKNWGQIE